MSEDIFRYFPLLTDNQKDKLSRLKQIYERWNSMINVISRKDMENFMIHHVLHSMAIAKIINFAPQTTILDVGTGGGFPGIPLAIMFPGSEFTLLDSIEKKIKVVAAVAGELELTNVTPLRMRVEDVRKRYNFVISRAVTEFPGFVKMTSGNIAGREINSLRNGVIYLKGGDLAGDIAMFDNKLRIWEIKEFFSEPFFETKKILYLSF